MKWSELYTRLVLRSSAEQTDVDLVEHDMGFFGRMSEGAAFSFTHQHLRPEGDVERRWEGGQDLLFKIEQVRVLDDDALEITGKVMEPAPPGFRRGRYTLVGLPHSEGHFYTPPGDMFENEDVPEGELEGHWQELEPLSAE